MLRAISDRLGLVALLPQRHEQLRGDPPAFSVAATEYQRPGGVHAYHHALGRLGNANDHLIALAAVVRDAEILPAFAAMTLLRISYEAALVARWVLDGSSDERLARGLRLHYDDLVERNKFENSIRPQGTELDDLATDGKDAAARMVELLEVAEQYGIVTTAADGRRSLKPVPSYTMLAETYPASAPQPAPESGTRNEGWFYRFLSAYAHGKQWVQTLGLTDPVSGAADSVVGQVEADDLWVYWTLERVWAHVDSAYAGVEALWVPTGGGALVG